MVIHQFYEISWRRQMQRRSVSLLLLLLVLTAASVQAFQAVHPLTGRRIAGVMGPGGADWLDRPEREAEENVEGALNAIGIQPGMTVAEVGAGTGYDVLRIAKRVGPGGKVFANDLQPEMLAKLRQNAAKAGFANVQTVLGGETDPKLPAGVMDLIILVDVRPRISSSENVAGDSRALKPDGRLVLLNTARTPNPIRPG
jgi:SAM-dependent methyltransferase